jgi:hypothetical protein
LKEELVTSIIEDLSPKEITPILESIDSKEENLYWETDDVNPNSVIYDLENNKTIIPTFEEEILPPSPPPLPVEKIISRNVSSRRRNIR